MARYFMHLRDGTDELLDPEGMEFASLDALRRAVLAIVRDLMSADIRNGVIDLRLRLDAETEHGGVVHSLPFRHAIKIIPEAATAE